MNLLQIYECRNCETEHYNSVLEITVSFLGIHKWEPDIYIGFSPALHLQGTTQIDLISFAIVYKVGRERPRNCHNMSLYIYQLTEFESWKGWFWVGLCVTVDHVSFVWNTQRRHVPYVSVIPLCNGALLNYHSLIADSTLCMLYIRTKIRNKS
jgi:hypothetical protein